MTEVQALTDPRPTFWAAQDWVAMLLDGIDATMFEDPTPCPDYTVGELAGHLIAVLDRARVVAEGGDVNAQPQVITAVPDDDFAAAFRQRLPSLSAVWTDAVLLAEVVVPPGVGVRGDLGMWKYSNEIVVHGWDLAVATGQPAEAPNGVSRLVLDRAPNIVPAAQRGGFVPFDPPVEPAPDAGPTERLANWNGHRR